MKKFIFKMKVFLKEYIFNKKIERDENRPICYIMLAATYGNMGDVAITVAQKRFLQECFPDYNIILIEVGHSFYFAKDILRKRQDKDIITIIGGGNTGDLYLDFELERRYIISRFKDFKIVSFPQTIDFSSSKRGKREMKKSIKIYNKNKNYHIFVRERNSYHKYKSSINNLYLCPDIVFSLKTNVTNVCKNGLLICLRDDIEKSCSLNISSLKKELNKKNILFKCQDTHIGEVKFSLNELEEILYDFLLNFQSSKLVITDRLHGMILSYITQTPCIVFDNTNKKISSTYKTWLNGIKGLFFLEEEDTHIIIEKIEQLYGQKIENIKVAANYEKLRNILIK